MPQDDAVDPTQVPQDDEEQRRKDLVARLTAAGTFLPIGARAGTPPAPSQGGGLPGPLAELVRDPRNLLMAAPMQAARIGAGSNRLPAGAPTKDTDGQPILAPGLETSAQPTTAAGIVAPIGGYQREPGSGLVLRGRGDAAAAAANGNAPQPASTPMDPNAAAPMQAPRIGPARSQPDLQNSGQTLDPNSAAPMQAPSIMSGMGQPKDPRLLETEPTRAQFPAKNLKGWRRALGAVAVGATAFGNGTEAGLKVSDELFAAPGREAEKEYQQAEQQYREDQTGARADARQASIDALNSRKEGLEIDELERKAKESPEDKKLESYVNDKGQQTIIFQKPDGSTYEKAFSKVQGKQTELTSPFEAYAYGTPAERQSAQDFLKDEKKYGADARQPGEIEQRYDLFKKDPDAYHAMFGDRGSQQEQAQASRMLTYFDKRRKEINGDWSLDEPTKAQQLAEIDQLETPYLDAAGSGAGEQRVTVVSPKGVTGTIPRSQLDAAKKKGYTLSEAQ